MMHPDELQTIVAKGTSRIIECVVGHVFHHVFTKMTTTMWKMFALAFPILRYFKYIYKIWKKIIT